MCLYLVGRSRLADDVFTCEESESIKKAKKIGVYSIDVKNTHECYMFFENVRNPHTFVRYWYEIRDILVPILHRA